MSNITGANGKRTSVLSYGKQTIDEQDIQAVIDVLRGDYLTTGPTIEAFEKAVAKYVGAKYAVAVSNGTAALHIAMLACGIGEDDEVLVTPMTFAASANAILYVGAKPVFVDIDPITYNIDVHKLEEKITPSTKAIVAVDFTGQPVDIEELVAIANKHKLIVIEDGAHSLGSQYKNKMVGNLVDATIFSFHPVKPITTGEGGIITTSNEAIYKRMLLFRTHGITRDIDLLEDKSKGTWYYEQQCLGYNYRLTDIQAALGLSQLKKIERFVARRRELVKRYNEFLKDVPGIICPCEKEDRKSGCHIYIIRVQEELFGCSREAFISYMQSKNIGVNVHYIPIYYHPYYKRLGYEKGICPITENIFEEIVTLPLYPAMKDEDIYYVLDSIIACYNLNKKA